MGRSTIAWEGSLSMGARDPQIVRARIVRDCGAYLNPTMQQGKGLRLEVRVDDGNGLFWKPIQPAEVTAVSLAVVLANSSDAETAEPLR